MSLFKARDWWSFAAGFEEFHVNNHSLAVANVDNSLLGSDKLVVSSYQGLLRIFAPQQGGYNPAHMILEKKLDPIIQVAVGRFVANSTHLHIAVLHPRLLAVHTIATTSNDQGVLYTLKNVYSHALERTAYNMTYGPFGGAKGRDFLCVQSMDGLLSFFQHDKSSFSCFLPDFLVPGPLGYLPKSDSIATVTSSHMMQSFKYQSLAVLANSSGTPDTSTKKKIAPEITVNVGEHCIDLVVKTSSSREPSQILLLGERTLFCFMESGTLKFAKKLDFSASCLHVYNTQTDENSSVVKFIIATHSNQLLVFRDTALVWAAHVEHPPTALAVANLPQLKGAIVCLDEVGHLSCSYLGTDPAAFVPNTLDNRAMDYQDAEKEMKVLQMIIKEAQKEGGVAVFDQDCLQIKLELSSSVKLAESEDDGLRKSIEVKLSMSYNGSSWAEDISVHITSSLPVSTHPVHQHWEAISNGQTVTHVITAICVPLLLPVCRTISVTACYMVNGVHRVTEEEVSLPLSLFCVPCQPSKAAEHKVTVDTNCPTVNLHDLFPELVWTSDGGAPTNAMGFKLLAGPEVTVVSSKSSDRYRLQSDCFPALAPFLDDLLLRLANHWKHRTPPFCACHNDKPPLNEYFEIIDNHHKLRMNLEQCKELLHRHAQQFRAIQKRLLMRFKDKTPVGLAHLDTLLEGTYMQIIALGDKFEMFQGDLERCSNHLGCATQLVTTVMRLSVVMSPDDWKLLQACLSCTVMHDCDQGWEEQTNAAITHLLHTTLAKNPKDHAAPPTALELLFDVHKLKRHIALLCDRLSKGACLSSNTSTVLNTPTKDGGMATQSLDKKPFQQPVNKASVLLGPSNHSSSKLPPLLESSTEDLEDSQLSEL